MLYTGVTRKEIDLGGRRLDPEITEQYNEFNRLGAQFIDDGDMARKTLALKYGRTYFYYYAFGISGVWQ